MKLIEWELKRAIEQHRDWRCANTEVVTNNNGSCDVFVHDNHIANVNGSTVCVNIQTLKQWPTRTTKSRLRSMGIDTEHLLKD